MCNLSATLSNKLFYKISRNLSAILSCKLRVIECCDCAKISHKLREVSRWVVFITAKQSETLNLH